MSAGSGAILSTYEPRPPSSDGGAARPRGGTPRGRTVASICLSSIRDSDAKTCGPRRAGRAARGAEGDAAADLGGVRRLRVRVLPVHDLRADIRLASARARETRRRATEEAPARISAAQARAREKRGVGRRRTHRGSLPEEAVQGHGDGRSRQRAEARGGTRRRDAAATDGQRLMRNLLQARPDLCPSPVDIGI